VDVFKHGSEGHACAKVWHEDVRRLGLVGLEPKDKEKTSIEDEPTQARKSGEYWRGPVVNNLVE